MKIGFLNNFLYTEPRKQPDFNWNHKFSCRFLCNYIIFECNYTMSKDPQKNQELRLPTIVSQHFFSLYSTAESQKQTSLSTTNQMKTTPSSNMAFIFPVLPFRLTVSMIFNDKEESYGVTLYCQYGTILWPSVHLASMEQILKFCDGITKWWINC